VMAKYDNFLAANPNGIYGIYQILPYGTYETNNGKYYEDQWMQ